MGPGADWRPEEFRDYLVLLTRLRLPKALQGKLDASDIVQEALLKAHEERAQFRGTTEAEWRGYLRTILANTLVDQVRRYARGKRELALERSLEADLQRSSVRLENWLAADGTGPPDRVVREEELLQLARALPLLAVDQRIALELRYLHDPPASLADIAQRLERTEKAAAGLLCRGLARLRELMHQAE